MYSSWRLLLGGKIRLPKVERRPRDAEGGRISKICTVKTVDYMHTIEIGHERHISTIMLCTSAIHVDSRCKIQDRRQKYRRHGILSCITHRPLHTKFQFKSENFVDGCTNGHWDVRSTRPNNLWICLLTLATRMSRAGCSSHHIVTLIG